MDIFEEYIKHYDLNNFKINLKYEHTKRVQKYCEIIAKDLGLEDNQIKIASLCGLFHDIARFEQETKFHTFNDLKSFDHGDVGFQIFNEEIKDKLDITDEEKNLVAKSILHHNKAEIGKVTKEEEIFCKIIRDADKLDIFYLLGIEKKLMPKSNLEISKKIKDKFFAHKFIRREDVSNDMEQSILHLCFLWDFNFDISYKIIEENSFLEKFENNLNNEVFKEYFKEAKRFIKEKTDGNKI